MTQESPIASTPPAPLGLVSRIVGIVISPRETFERIVAHPQWLGMLLVVIVVSAGASFWFLSTAVGQQAMLDQQVKSTEAFGIQLDDAALQQMEAQAPMMRYLTLASTIVVTPVMLLIVAGILFGVFSAILGGGASFKHVFATVVHANVISLLGQVFTYPLSYLRQSMSGATNLGALLPMLPEGSFVARLAGMIDLFIVWWVLVLAIGLAVAYRRKTQPIAIALLAVYAVIAVGIAAVQALWSAR